jgi:cobyrinic acid a,c-diamide synthase
MPRKPEWSLPSRHLGLLSAGEIANVKSILAGLGRQAEQTLDVYGLLELAKTAPDLARKPSAGRSRVARVRLAVARDEAFCFLYEENLELFRRLGCEIVWFSPMRDKALPGGIQGLYLPGGYPELHGAALSENASMRAEIRRAMGDGLPTVAEGGGFLYLHDSLDGRPMCGAIPGAARETKRLQRFGYIELTATRDNLLCKAGESIQSHEFHYWESDNPGDGFTARKAGRDLTYACVHATDSLYGGFPHLYFPGNPGWAANWIERMAEYEG